MWLRIVPLQFLVAASNFVTIPVYHNGQTVIHNSLTNDQPDAVIEAKFARYARQRSPTSDKCHGGPAHRWELLIS
jgi:hypothetical protein